MRRSISTVALATLVTGCAGTSAATPPAMTAPAAARAAAAKAEKPLEYRVEFRNRLPYAMHVTVVAAKGVSYTGPLTFPLEPHKVENGVFKIPAFVPGELLTVTAAGTEPSEKMREEFSIVDSRLAFTMHLRRKSAVAGYTEISLASPTSVNVLVETRPAQPMVKGSLRTPMSSDVSEYSVTVDNCEPKGALDGSVVPGGDTTVDDPTSFQVDPESSDTVTSSDSDTIGEVEQIEMQEKSGTERAVVDVSAASGDEVSLAISQLFGSYGQQYQAISAQAAAYHDQFNAALASGSAAYLAAESANCT